MTVPPPTPPPTQLLSDLETGGEGWTGRKYWLRRGLDLIRAENTSPAESSQTDWHGVTPGNRVQCEKGQGQLSFLHFSVLSADTQDLKARILELRGT